MRQLAIAVATLIAAVAAAQQAPAPATPPPPSARSSRSQFRLTVTDENGDAVRQARITLSRPGTPVAWVGATDYRGLAALPIGSGGVFHLRVDKEGYYAADLQQNFQPGASLDVSMHHVQEYRETVQVNDSVPGVDPARISETQQLTNREIFSLPYPTTRDYRNVLPFLPGVVQQPNGDINVAGAAAYELFATLDGFDITNPSGSPLEMRLSPDVLRRIDLQESRYSPQFGKGAGGVLQLESNMGDDHYRFTATNFVPGINLRGGITPETFDPRLTFSGPIARGRAWFIDGLSGEYDWNIDRDLPKPIQDNPAWRVDNLAKVQVNLAPNNILTTSFLVNHGKSERVGLSLFTPPESTFDQHINNYLADIKDSIYLGSHTLLEAGFGYSDIFFDQLPRGDLPFVQTPSTVSGSFFQTTSSDTRRYQAFSNLYLPPRQWHGRHEFLVGVDLDRIDHDRFLLRRPIDILTQAGTLSQIVTFAGPPRFGVNNTEGTVFAQDRWSVSDRLLLEYGARGDWDQIVRNPVASPRAAATYLLPHTEATKLSVGVGLVYDRTNLNFIELPLIGQRFDQLFAANGVTPIGAPLVTIFSANTRALEMPRYLNWSVGLERMIGKWYAKVNYLQKRGSHGFAFINQSAPTAPSIPPNGLYDLESVAQPKYDAVEFTVRRTFAVNHEFFISYTRSDARSNAAVDFTTTTLFAQQAGGPLPWDAPNRVVSWGWLPIARKWDFAYSAEWRTGFPFSAVNQLQELVGSPDQFRFPDFFTLNVHVEYRFRFHGYEWAVRGGFNNVTGRRNPAVVNNNVDSPDFMTFSTFQHRVFTGRIRLLGRK